MGAIRGKSTARLLSTSCRGSWNFGSKGPKYFSGNKARMQYKAFEEAGIPRGSGAIESAIRRVVNQRLKGNAKFWKEANAESMLLLRSYLKAGRFDDLMRWSLLQAAPWWEHGSPRLCSPVEAP